MSSMKKLLGLFLLIGVVSCDFPQNGPYGPPGYSPGIPIGSEGGAQEAEPVQIRSQGYQVPQNYATPTFSSLSTVGSDSPSYAAPALSVSSSQSYGVPTGSQNYRAPGLSDSTSQAYGAPAGSNGGPQSYGAPGGGSSGSRSQSYGAPSSGSAQSYGVPLAAPLSSQSYGAPGSGSSGSSENSRYRIVPANNLGLPEQHSNLIRYIVLKEFRIPPNGTIEESQMGGGFSSSSSSSGGSAGGYGSPELEIMKVESGSGERTRQQNQQGYDLNENEGGAEDSGRNNLDDDNEDSNDINDDENDEDEDYDDDVDSNSVSGASSSSGNRGQTGGNSNTPSGNSRQGTVMGMAGLPGGMQLVPARGVPLATGRRPNNRPQSSETEAFMFSDPASTSREQTSSRRQSTGSTSGVFSGVRNQIQNTRNRVRNNSNRNRNRNRNRSRNNNRNRNRSQPQSSPGSSMQSANAVQNAPEFDQIQSALNVLSQYFSAQAELMRQGGGSGGSGSGGTGSSSGRAAESTGTSSTTSGSSSSTESASSSSSGSSGATSSSTSSLSTNLDAPTGGVSSYSNIGGTSGSGAYQSSGQPESTTSTESATQATFPASTYGPPPGSPGFGGAKGASANIFAAITGPIRQVHGLKASILSSVVSGFTNGVKGDSGSGGYGPPAASATPTNPSPVYGPPTGETNPLKVIKGIKGSIVNTVANKGRAAVGIVGTKGRLVVNQVGTGANLVTNGISQTLNNKHDAFQNVIKHIQSIFNSNPGILNNAGGYGAW